MPLPIAPTCNFRCTFCDRVWPEAEVPVDQVLEQAPMSELGGLRAVLGGGEPTLHPQLPQIIEGLRARGVRKLSIRTNAAWASREAPVAFLKRRGLTQADVLFPTHDPAVFDELTRREGAWDAVTAGVRNLAARGVRLTARVPLIQPTLPTLEETLQRLPQLIEGLVRIDLVHLDLADPRLQVTYEDINAALPSGSAHPWPDVPPVFLDPGPGVPLCRSHEMNRWELSPDVPTAPGHKPEPCQRCFVRNACSGISKGLHAVRGAEGLRPVPLDFDEPERRVERSVQGAFEPVKGVTYECGEDETPSLASVRLRVGHACNRRCDFCFIPHHEKAVHDHDIPASIQAAVDAGARELVMTGGEPTLVKDLPRHIAQASQGGIRRIVLQTNAMRLANPDFTQRLVDSGLTSTVISLHSHRDDVLESITTLPNTMDRILRGIRNLHEAGIQASVTHVIGPKNHMHLPDFTRFMIEEADLRRFCFIFATPMAWPMARRDLIVRYADAAPHVMAAMDVAIDNDVVVDGLAFKCGAPHCVVGGEPRYLLDAVPIPEENRTPDWMRIPACERCTLRGQCYGVRRLYAWLYGIDEFQPVLEDGKRADDWNRGRFLPRATPASDHDPVAALLDQVRTLDLDPPVAVESPIDGGYRFRSGAASMGSLARAGTRDEARAMAQAMTVQLRAVGVDLDGSHTVSSASPERVVAALDQDGVEHLLPHTTTRWSEVVEAADRDGVRILRRTSPLPMASVASAVAAASAALVELGGGRLIRYGIWGFGRAGRLFAKRFDGVLLGGNRRPTLVACADSSSAVLDPRGLEFERLAAFKTRHGRLPRPVQSQHAPDAVFEQDLDVLLLAGRGVPLGPDQARALGARVVVDMTGRVPVEIEDVLVRRGVVLVPSLLATCGPLLVADAERRGVAEDARALVAAQTAGVYRRARALGGRMSDALIRLALDQSVSGNRSGSSGDRSKGTSPTSP